MTVITKASDMGRKPDVMSAPLVVESRYDPERVSPRPPRRAHVMVYRSNCSLLMLSFTVVLLLAGAVLGLVYYCDAHQESPWYKGYCAIPIEVPRDVRLQKQAALASSRVPLRWSVDEPEVTVLSAEESDGAFNLLERFDINTDDNFEKILVYNGGNNVVFVHDFNANATAIVDKNRCFVMELDPSVVLSPDEFVVSIERGDAFDVMRVRSHLRALLPPAPAPYAGLFAEKCLEKPTYQLQKDDNIIRKRSIGEKEPEHDYLHFAGKHVQEISIGNLQELLDYEKMYA